MGDNSLDWATILAGSLDSDEMMSLLINDVKGENPEDELQPATLVPYQQNTHNVMGNVETGSSSFLNDQNIQNNMMSNGGCLVNPLGFPYRPQMHVLPVNIEGRNKMQETMAEAQQRKRMNKIKNRISAAKSRAKSQEHTRFLEEKVEQLRNENAYLKKLLSLDVGVLPEERKGFAVKRQNSI